MWSSAWGFLPFFSFNFLLKVSTAVCLKRLLHTTQQYIRLAYTYIGCIWHTPYYKWLRPLIYFTTEEKKLFSFLYGYVPFYFFLLLQELKTLILFVCSISYKASSILSFVKNYFLFVSFFDLVCKEKKRKFALKKKERKKKKKRTSFIIGLGFRLMKTI